MDYALRPAKEDKGGKSFASAARTLTPLLADEKPKLILALACMTVSTGVSLLTPWLIAHVIDTAIARADYRLLLSYAGALALAYITGLATGYVQTISMGTVGRNLLFKLRNRLFGKLSSLPIAFFAQNKAGDLISRVNNDSEKINQFFAQALMQFFGAFFVILGSGTVLLVLNWRLGLAALAPALAMLIITRQVSPWVKRVNRKGLESLGGLSGDVQESLSNFKIIVAFNRTDFFREKFDRANQKNFRASIASGIASGLFTPLYALAGAAGSIVVLGLGVWLIGRGQLTVGLLIGYLLYVTNFYNPLRQVAAVWSSLQQAMAALERVSEVLSLDNNLVQIGEAPVRGGQGLLSFDHVGFSYPNGKRVLEDVSFTLVRGKTYALVGPTGGGKTTTAMLMARLYDPSEGVVRLDGRDIRAFSPAERARRIGFILQEPLLISGTVRDNIVYAHEALAGLDEAELMRRLTTSGLAGFVDRFSEGLATPIAAVGEALSLGQKQLIAFMRAVLRQPEILILDEATANIDTVTEQLLEAVLDRLPKSTTKVIIAHRLNTIRNADDIFFVGGGALTEAGSMEHALDMLLSTERVS